MYLVRLFDDSDYAIKVLRAKKMIKTKVI